VSAVVHLRLPSDPATVPWLVLVDMQREYIAQPRLMALPDAQGALDNCRAALAHARGLGLPVAFMRLFNRSAFFNAATPFSHWIEGFEPMGCDMVFERERPSCYSSPQFANVMNHAAADLVIAGFAGETACLATAIDAFHRDQRITFLSDASASHALDDIPAADTHAAVTKIIGLYAQTLDTGTWLKMHPPGSHARRRSG
jgi:nicotinamidase-related amidase